MSGNNEGYNHFMSKVMVSMSDELLRRLDREAERRSMSRSSLLALAAQRELARRDSSVVTAAIERSEKRFRASGRFDAADLIRKDRDRRR